MLIQNEPMKVKVAKAKPGQDTHAYKYLWAIGDAKYDKKSWLMTFFSEALASLIVVAILFLVAWIIGKDNS